MTKLLLGAVLALFTITLSSFGQPLRDVYFEDVLVQRLGLKNRVADLQKFCPTEKSVVASRVLKEYGAMFIGPSSVVLPQTCIYSGEKTVADYQGALKTKELDLGVKIALQVPAAEALQAAVNEASAIRRRMTPLDGTIAGGRSYGDTLTLWNSRFFPALEYWTRRGRITREDADLLIRLDVLEKIEKVLELESKGILFGTGRNRSIFSSTAPPGASQHIALIAFDVVEYANPDIKRILNRNGWYQTVVDDPPHFTYLGFPESELPKHGLIAVLKGRRQYWIPNIGTWSGYGGGGKLTGKE
jgi:hypothetical protein